VIVAVRQRLTLLLLQVVAEAQEVTASTSKYAYPGPAPSSALTTRSRAPPRAPASEISHAPARQPQLRGASGLQREFAKAQAQPKGKAPWTVDNVRRTLQCEVFPYGPIDLGGRFGEGADDGYFYIDAVFEGGGMKGFAFLGALEAFEFNNIRFRKVAGTSAGAALLHSG
jgi:Patatin-like phospholipase